MLILSFNSQILADQHDKKEIEEETPDLFDSNNLDNSSNEASELSEESEFEIPAFLRRQKN